MSRKRMGGLRLVWLEAFLAIVDRGSFSSAAEFLGCNQSSVTRNIADLDLWLGYKLFTRTAPLQLSSEGEDFVATAQRVLELLNSSRSEYRLDKESVPRSSLS